MSIVIIVALLWSVMGLFIYGVLRQRGGHQMRNNTPIAAKAVKNPDAE